MNGAFYIGATGLDAQERALQVVANNIANINTPGFKRSQVRFSEVLGAAPTGETARPLTGVAAETSARVFDEGELKPTGRPMDLAINGDGFIEVMGPSGQTLLWRGGSLKVDAEGYLAASNDMTLKSMVSVPADASSITIGPDGKVQAIVAGSDKPTDIGQIDLVRVRDLSTLAPAGDGLYAAQDAALTASVAPGKEGAGVLAQGSLETSNVQLSDEMVSLLLMQRAYAANAQVVQAGDQLMSIANELKR